MTKPTKGSVVRHSKIGSLMTLWVKTGEVNQADASSYFRFALQSGRKFTEPLYAAM